jgi:hypothetical protein
VLETITPQTRGELLNCFCHKNSTPSTTLPRLRQCEAAHDVPGAHALSGICANQKRLDHSGFFSLAAELAAHHPVPKPVTAGADLLLVETTGNSPLFVEVLVCLNE